ncbi:MAG: helix-turn-helix transcriptional regulator [Clostridia bacterium]|nr:helix-turn-helix transcriptional regulator [Clostridia bacterium]
MKNIAFSEMDPVLWRVQFCVFTQSEQIRGKFSYAKRLFWMQEGKCKLYTNTTEYTLHAGDVFFLPSDTWYATEIVCGVHLTNIFFDFVPNEQHSLKQHFVFHDEYDPDLSSEGIHFTDTDLFEKPFLLSLTPVMENRMQELAGEEVMRMNAYRLRQRAILTDLLVLMYRNGSDTAKYSHETPAEKILQYIIEHCEEPMNRHILSQVFHFHPNTISHMVQTATGMTLQKYIEDTRIRKALMLLADINLRIVDIAHRLQYYDSSHFSAIFQKHIGCTPTEYRRRLS